MRKYSPIMPFPRRYSAMILFSFLAVFLAPVFAEEDIALVDLEVSLVKEFSGASIKAISPDGKNVFISDWETSEKKASLIKIGTWEIVKSFNFESPIVLADFFSDSQGLFIFNLNIDQLVLDLNTGQQTVVKKNASRSPYVRGTALPVHGRNILIRYRADSPGIKDLVLVEFPSYKVIKKVPYATQPHEPRIYDEHGLPHSTEYGYEISNNREILAYSFDNVLVCRRTKDLEVLWTRKIEAPLKAYSMVSSPNGDYIASEIADDGDLLSRKESYISVFDGNNGAELVKLPLLFPIRFAVSPNGRLFAFSEIKQGENKKKWLSIAQLYELPSGRKLSSVEHNRIRGGNDLLKTAFIIQFTPDGKYMITSGNGITKIWELSGEVAETKITLRDISSK